MKKISELSNIELYNIIFNPIFGYKLEYPESWDVESILNKKHNYYPYIRQHYPEIEEELKNIELKLRNGNTRIWYELSSDIIHEINAAKSEYLEKYNLYEEIMIPSFCVSKTKKGISVYLKSEIINRVLFGKVDTFSGEYTDHHSLDFFKNGDIKISNTEITEFRTSLFNKNMYSVCNDTPRYLSYTETIAMKKYFEKLNIDILN